MEVKSEEVDWLKSIDKPFFRENLLTSIKAKRSCFNFCNVFKKFNTQIFQGKTFIFQKIVAPLLARNWILFRFFTLRNGTEVFSKQSGIDAPLIPEAPIPQRWTQSVVFTSFPIYVFCERRGVTCKFYASRGGFTNQKWQSIHVSVGNRRQNMFVKSYTQRPF